MACYNFDIPERILIFFGRNVTDKVSNQMMLYHATSSNLCFRTTWRHGETRKLHFSFKSCISAPVAAWFLQSFWLVTHHAALLNDSLNFVVNALSSGLLGAWFRRKEVESAAAVGLCCTHNAPLLSSEFPISPGSAEPLNRWGGKTKYRLISYFLINTSAKYYRHRIVYVKIKANQRWDVFRDTVYNPADI